MLLIKNGIVVTMNGERAILEDGAIAVSGARIAAVGRTAAVEHLFQYDQIIDARDKLVLPGFVNAHTHLFQTPLRGFGDDVPLREWLNRAIYPFARHMDEKACYVAARLGIAEMIKSGVTTYADSHYLNGDPYCFDSIARATLETGMRGVISRASMDRAPAPEALREPVDRAERECSRVIECYNGYGDGLLSVRVEPMNEVTASKALIKAMYGIAKEYGVGMCMHLVETRARMEESVASTGRTPVEMLHDLGVLGPHLLLAHCVWTTEQDRLLLQGSGTAVVHNAVANQYLGDGAAPILDYMDRGIRVALGTDGAAGNNSLDMFAVMKAACLLQKVTSLAAEKMSALKALEMATIGGARALGMADRIGSIETDKYADLLLVDLNTLQMVPRRNYISNIVYAASPAVVDTVMIHGKTVLKDKAFTQIDEGAVIADANELLDQLAEKSLERKTGR